MKLEYRSLEMRVELRYGSTMGATKAPDKPLTVTNV